MPNGQAQLRAKLAWEAAYERLRNAIQPPRGAPFGTREERLKAFELAQESLDALRAAFEVEPREAPDLANAPMLGDQQHDGPDHDPRILRL